LGATGVKAACKYVGEIDPWLLLLMAIFLQILPVSQTCIGSSRTSNCLAMKNSVVAQLCLFSAILLSTQFSWTEVRTHLSALISPSSLWHISA